MWGIFVSLIAGVAAMFSDFEIRERTGDYFLSTRTPFEASFGMRFFDLGYAWSSTVVAPLVLCPTGLILATTDKFVLSPVWDILCLPVDAMKDSERKGETEPPEDYEPPIYFRTSPFNPDRPNLERIPLRVKPQD